MADSAHDRLERVRKPRVHIRCDVEIGDAKIVVDLPFVMGVMGDFSGNPTQPLKPLRDRKFIEIDRDNCNAIMKRMTPGLDLRVENTLDGKGEEMGVQLAFESLDDFEPAQVAKQVPALKKLLETRAKLREALTKVDLSPEYEKAIENILKNPDNITQLADQLGVSNKGGDA